MNCLTSAPALPSPTPCSGIASTGPADAAGGQPKNENRGLGQAVWDAFETFGQALVGACNHGHYCGQYCDGEKYIKTPEDDLDRACRNHDWTLKHAASDDKCVKCGSHKRLVAAAKEVRKPICSA